jgi:hypothetical protein
MNRGRNGVDIDSDGRKDEQPATARQMDREEEESSNFLILHIEMSARAQ